jgi:hypothetical protein
MMVLLMVGSAVSTWTQKCEAQCCLDGLFAGFGSCCRKAPQAYAIAPVAAPMVAPIPAPPPPVMVPVQQVSYVPETTYRTQYQCVPVTSYKPTCEVDPCTGCTRECMEQVTNYVQQAVNVPVTQYRAVYSTKYVQMQPGAGAAPMPGYPAAMAPGAVAPSASPSPFASPVQTTPQAWGSAGGDIPQQILPGQTSIAAPTLPQGFVPQGAVQQPPMPQPTYQQQIVPQGGTYAAPAPAPMQLQPTTPPALQPTPSLKPIPELPRTAPGQAGGAAGAMTMPRTYAASPAASQPAPMFAPGQAAVAPAAPSLTPGSSPAPAASGTGSGSVNGSGPAVMPVVPGTGPGASTGAFPRLLEPTSHTTSWQPAAGRPTAYPTAALPGRLQ